jgi:LemA protein
MSLVLLVIAALLLFWGLGAYNRIMRLRSAVASSWQAHLEPPLLQLANDGLRLAEAGPGWLPAEGPAFEALRQQSLDLQQALRAVQPGPWVADPVAQLAVAQALQASALQRVLALIEHHVQDHDAERSELTQLLRKAQQQREFGRQLFNQRVQAYNQAIGELPTRVLAGLYGFHDAKTF